MEKALEMYLLQIVKQRKIPFEITLSDDKPINLGSLSDSEFDLLMDQAYQQYNNDECISIEDFEDELKKLGI